MEALHKENISQIANTHTHEDHIGANGLLQQRRQGLKIYAHPLAMPILENPREAQPLQLYRRTMWGWPLPSYAQPVADADVIETGKYRFEVIYTPGHSPDHICLYEPTQGWLFTGDLFVGGKDRALRAEYDVWQIINSLKRVAGLPLTRMFPGCARVRENPQQELANKIEYLEKTGEKVLALRRQGMSISRIAQALFGGPMLIEVFTLGHFTRRGLVKSYLAG